MALPLSRRAISRPERPKPLPYSSPLARPLTSIKVLEGASIG